MRGKRYIGYLLLVIGLLMPIIPVIPHHHHADGRICLKHDLTNDCCAGDHHEESDHRCGDDCVTMHFFEQAPGSNESWNYSFVPEEITLFIKPLLSLNSTTTEIQTDTPYYRERLRGTFLVRAKGLRAPPCA